MASNTTEQVWEWLRACPFLDTLNRFRVDYSSESPTEYVLYSMPSAINYRENILGEEVPDDIQTLAFSFALKDSYGPDVQQNLKNIGFFDSVCAWILEQNALRNLPVIDDGTVKSIVPTLTAYPVAVGTDAALYQIQIRLTYRRI